MPNRWHKRGLVFALPDRQRAMARLAIGSYATALLVALATQVWPGAAPPPAASTGLLPPVGMLVFCQSHASQCEADPVAQVRWTPDLARTLQAVNRSVNKAIRPQNDKGGRDVWSVNVKAGDCEDYALTKRAALIRRGVPAGALRMAVTRYKGEGHAVLVVKTTAGDLVLDNLHAKVMPLGRSGYRISMMASANPHIWTELVATPADFATAASGD